MKISSFYLNDISEYDDIVGYLTNTITEKFYGIGKNSISISRFMTFIKRALKSYIRIKYQKDINIIITLPTIDEKLIQHDTQNDNVVKLRLSYETVVSILIGEYETFNEYIEEIVEQLDTELTSNNKFSFIEYLTTQMPNMVDVALIELKSSFSDEYLRENIVKKDSWIKLSQESSVFKDYYLNYMENTSNKKLFFTFLKNLVKRL